MQRKMYPSDMTDSEWEIVIPLIEKECTYIGGPKVTLNEYREILNCIFYICKTGVQWEYIPHDFPPPTTVNYHYLKFSRNGLLEKINDTVRGIVRTKKYKKNEIPSCGVIDSQSVKSMSEAKGNEVGFDGGKKVNGRKRSILTDTMGYVISALVHAANIYDGKAGMKLIDKALNKYQLKKIWADNTYRGEFVKYAKDKYNCDIEINQRKNNEAGFKPVRKRWVVERTLAWLTRNRRLAREYERTIESSEAMIYTASLRLLLKHATR